MASHGRYLCTGQFQNRPCPPWANPAAFDLKKLGQIPRYVASLDGQMPHPSVKEGQIPHPPST